ncbi:hypothetical protein TrLO_g7841 [Triparma laevis f. longispina]|uniref:Uncharacterized protein n=1 Tax=Triparma laevis f. longispina TaxID=1714387 RepID=A0A9W7KXZ5_9STRA|nr:hypothetical protein TrLO_g7841 [Triparma laevis f. longispina]
MGGSRGAGDEEKEDEGRTIDLPPLASLPISSTVSTAPAATDQFMHTPEFRRHFVDFVPLGTLLTMKAISKEFKEMTREYIARRVESGEMVLHRGVDIIFDPENSSSEEKQEFVNAALRKNKLVT